MAETSRVIVTEDAIAKAAVVLADAASAIARARVAIPGGSAMAAVGPAKQRMGAAWQDVRLTWVDERCVDFADADSNRGAASRAGILMAAPALQLPLYIDRETPEQALARVTAAFERDFEGALDVVLLGIGADGHVASLFPGRGWNDGVVTYITDSPKPPPCRLTLTRPVLATATTTIVLATGEAKRDVLHRLVSGDATLPAYGLPGLVVVTDQDIA